MCAIDLSLPSPHSKGSGLRSAFVRGECGGYEKFWDVHGLACAVLNHQVWFCSGKNAIIFAVIFRVR